MARHSWILPYKWQFCDIFFDVLDWVGKSKMQCGSKDFYIRNVWLLQKVNKTKYNVEKWVTDHSILYITYTYLRIFMNNARGRGLKNLYLKLRGLLEIPKSLFRKKVHFFSVVGLISESRLLVWGSKTWKYGMFWGT